VGALIVLRRVWRSVVAAPEDRVETRHRPGVQGWPGVVVSVECDGHLLVSQHLAHDLGVGAGRQVEGGERVAQIVEPDGRELGPAKQRLELQGCDESPQSGSPAASQR
jgi:hypothetical protein